MRCLIAELRERPRVWARMGFPAVCYTVGAILQMVGGANLDASMGQVTFQSKIIFTAACSVALLGTRLSRAQLVAIFILTAGVVLADAGPALLHSAAAPKPTLRPMHPRLGVAAWLGAALCSAFASVYFEKMVKVVRVRVRVRVRRTLTLTRTRTRTLTLTLTLTQTRSS